MTTDYERDRDEQLVLDHVGFDGITSGITGKHRIGKPYVNMGNSMMLSTVVAPIRNVLRVRCMNPPTIPAAIVPLNASVAACSSALTKMTVDMYQKGMDTVKHGTGTGRISAVNTLMTATVNNMKILYVSVFETRVTMRGTIFPPTTPCSSLRVSSSTGTWVGSALITEKKAENRYVSVPWGGVLIPNALLNENMCALVNQPMHGIPLCLKSSDSISDESMGGSSSSNPCASVSTILLALILFSLSWCALSIVALLLGVRALPSSNVHVVHIPLMVVVRVGLGFRVPEWEANKLRGHSRS